VFPNASSWLSAEQLPAAQVAAERAMLRRDHFREAAREDLSNGGTAGLSIVEQFGSPQAARAALLFYVAQIKAGESGNFESFSVHGIPGAEGLGDKHNSGVNIAFSDGPYYYLVGQEGGGPTAIAGLNAAALHLYRRVHQ
jgi:prepilin-type processing-associated H-X9-DG protein